MASGLQFGVGDKLVEYGQVYRVFKVTGRKGLKGKIEVHLFYRPYFKSRINKTLICSLPTSQVVNTSIRTLSTKTTIREALRSLAKRTVNQNLTSQDAETMLKEGDPLVTAKLLKQLWLQKQTTDNGLTTKNQLLFDTAFRNLAQETSVVLGMKIADAEDKIIAQLTKLSPAKPKLTE